MEIGIIGLGRMGNGVAARLLEAGHTVVAYNRSREKTELLQKQGAQATFSLEELVNSLKAPRTIWLYLPSGDVTIQYLNELMDKLEPGDTIIDGGNSHFTETIAMAEVLHKRNLKFLDVGTSGGVAGRVNGYCLMIGGEESLFTSLTPLWEAVAQKDGYKRVGPSGSGHYVKMVHNAIEYGMMQAYGEGMELLSASQFANDLQLEQITEVWQHGSIIKSYLGELLNEAMHDPQLLSSIGSRIDDNGEGKWAIEEAIDRGIAMPVITASLYARYQSRQTESFGHKIVAILRNKFGGHALSTPQSKP